MVGLFIVFAVLTQSVRWLESVQQIQLDARGGCRPHVSGFPVSLPLDDISCIEKLVPAVRLELTTYRVKAGCSEPLSYTGDVW